MGQFFLIDKLNIEPVALDLLALAVGNASNEKMHYILRSYIDNSKSSLTGAYKNNELVGIIGLNITGKVAIIEHIGVKIEYRRQNIGQRLISDAITRFNLTEILAETDDESKEFYSKCGFEVIKFKGPYNQRYKCIYKVKYI